MRRGELLDFYHGQFREAAKRGWMVTDAQHRAAHTRLARFFQDRLDESYGRALSELPYHLASAGLDAELLQLTGEVDYLEDSVAHHGIGDTLAHLGQAMEALDPESGARPRFARQLEVLSGEAGSFGDWSRERPFPDLFNQLSNGAARRGHGELFRRIARRDSGGNVGSVALHWALGGTAVDVTERMTMPGVRDSYSWDVYDYGPLGSQT
jgi:hypothetical protein